jgi:hypothetical protein
MWSAEDADLDVALALQAIGKDAQRDGLAGTGDAGDEGEAALADELLGAPAELLGASRHVQRLDGHVGCERVPLEAVESQHLLVHEPSPSSSFASSLGR